MKKAIVIPVGSPVAEVKLIYSSNVPVADRPVIRSSADAVKILKETWTDGTLELFESFKILLMNRANAVVGVYQVSTGGIAGTVVDARLVFTAALKAAVSSIILCHNHPSGNRQPSQADISLTRKLVDGGSLLDIAVLDHIIITAGNEFYSFADEGMI